MPSLRSKLHKPSAVLANGLYGNYKRSGGPGTNDPGRMILENLDIASLIMKAYDIPLYLLSAPESLSNIRFDVTATLPPGATKEQFLLMQQNLLTTRLGLVVHREKKETPVYELIVAKGGSKLKPAAPPGDSPAAPSFDKDGFPVLLPGHTMFTSTGDHQWIRAPPTRWSTSPKCWQVSFRRRCRMQPA
jgi:uncharacterized protein (TIGR03435 family)